MMWQASPVAFGPMICLTFMIFPVNGDLFLYVFTGTVLWSQYGSASRKSCFLAPKIDLIELTRPICTVLIRELDTLLVRVVGCTSAALAAPNVIVRLHCLHLTFCTCEWNGLLIISAWSTEY